MPTEDTITTRARDVIAAARTRIVRSLPYFSSPVLALRPFALPGLGTFGVDERSRMAFDPDVALSWGVVYTASAVLHEALHILFNHHERRRGRQPAKWNLAADCECNRTLLGAGFEFPPNFRPVTSDSLGLPPNLTAEEYYNLIPDDKANAIAAQSGESGESFPGAGTACGSCAGNPQGWEERVDELSGGLEGQSAADQRAMRRATAEKILAHKADPRKGIGDVPKSLRLWAEIQLQKPVVPWPRILAALVRSAVASRSGADDYTRSRVSRRSTAYLGRMPILPALRSPKPEVAVVIDVSGSMVGAPVRRAVSEACGVVHALGFPVRVLAVDAGVHADVLISGKKDVEKLNVGGGGTNMVVGIRAADRPRNGASPDVIVLITDGETPWPTPAEMPRAKLVVAVIGPKHKVPKHIRYVVPIPAGKAA